MSPYKDKLDNSQLNTNLSDFLSERVQLVECKKATTLDEKLAARKLHSDVYLEHNFISDSMLGPSGVLEDEFVEHSTYYNAFARGEHLGSVRVIPKTIDGFPLGKLFDLDSNWIYRLLSSGSTSMVEAGSFATIKSEEFSSVTPLAMFRALLIHCIENSMARYIIFGLEPAWAQLLISVYGIEVRQIGEPVFCYGATRVPAVVDVHDNLARMSVENPSLFSFFSAGVSNAAKQEESPFLLKASSQSSVI